MKGEKMKRFINIEIWKDINDQVIVISVLFYKWEIARFKMDRLDNHIEKL